MDDTGTRRGSSRVPPPVFQDSSGFGVREGEIAAPSALSSTYRVFSVWLRTYKVSFYLFIYFLPCVCLIVLLRVCVWLRITVIELRASTKLWKKSGTVSKLWLMEIECGSTILEDSAGPL
jgi:hypothetical protein